MTTQGRLFAIVTGASSGIGRELAKLCAQNGYDLLIAADEPEIHEAAQELRTFGGQVEAQQVDLATLAGVDRLYAAAQGRPVDALLANAGHGLGQRLCTGHGDVSREPRWRDFGQPGLSRSLLREPHRADQR